MEESRSTDYFRESKKKKWQKIKVVFISERLYIK
jgi:hypothetical protein